MHSVTLDSSGSPKKRTFSRGLSEDESLRSIITETETSSRRLTRSDSRSGAPKRRSDSQSEKDHFMGLPDMMELQASYDEVVQELRGLEVERETLLFQVDVLQDTLESVEELLAEAQREAGEASSELVQEREAKRKLESMVGSLMQEVERLKEERMNAPVQTQGSEDEATTRERQMENRDTTERIQAARTEENEASLCEPDCSESRGGAPEEATQGEGEEEEESVLKKLRRIVNKPLGHIPTLALENPLSEDGVHWRPFENGTGDDRDPSPDTIDSDNLSAYEDASAETPEQDRLFPGDGDTADLPDDSENKEKSPADNCLVDESKGQDPKSPEACILS